MGVLTFATDTFRYMEDDIKFNGIPFEIHGVGQEQEEAPFPSRPFVFFRLILFRKFCLNIRQSVTS